MLNDKEMRGLLAIGQIVGNIKCYREVSQIFYVFLYLRRFPLMHNEYCNILELPIIVERCSVDIERGLRTTALSIHTAIHGPCADYGERQPDEDEPREERSILQHRR